MKRSVVDAVLVQWGDRLFYPANRMVRADPARLTRPPGNADLVRKRIEAIVVRRAPQAFVKVSGGGRGMAAIAAHFAYISRRGSLAIEDERGLLHEGRDGIRDLVDQWQHSGARIDRVSNRRESSNLVLSAPVGSAPSSQRDAARAFALTAMRGHRFVMVQHVDRPNPHVHLTVRRESSRGVSLDTWGNFWTWRETYARELRAHGIDVEATRQAATGSIRVSEALWRVRARSAGVLRNAAPSFKAGDQFLRNRMEAMLAWSHIMDALAASEDTEDRKTANAVAGFIRDTQFYRSLMAERQRDIQPIAARQSAADTSRDANRMGHTIEMTR